VRKFSESNTQVSINKYYKNSEGIKIKKKGKDKSGKSKPFDMINVRYNFISKI